MKLLLSLVIAAALIATAVGQTINIVASCGAESLSAGTTTSTFYMDTTGRICVNTSAAPPSACNGAINLNLGCSQPMFGGL